MPKEKISLPYLRPHFTRTQLSFVHIDCPRLLSKFMLRILFQECTFQTRTMMRLNVLAIKLISLIILKNHIPVTIISTLKHVSTLQTKSGIPSTFQKVFFFYSHRQTHSLDKPSPSLPPATEGNFNQKPPLSYCIYWQRPIKRYHQALIYVFSHIPFGIIFTALRSSNLL